MIGIVRGLPRFDGRIGVLDLGLPHRHQRCARRAPPPAPAPGATRRRRRRTVARRRRPAGRTPRRRGGAAPGHRRRPRRSPRGVPRAGRAARRRRPRLRRDRRGAVDPARHRQVEDRARPFPARRGAREPRRDVGTSNTTGPSPGTTDTMNDDQRLLANAYLDGEVSAEERARAEADPEVVAEIARLRAVSEALRVTDEPDPQRRDAAIHAALDAFELRPAATIATTPELPVAPPVSLDARRRARWLRPLAAAAAVVVLIAGGVALLGDRDEDSGDDASSPLVAGDDRPLTATEPGRGRHGRSRHRGPRRHRCSGRCRDDDRSHRPHRSRARGCR